MSRTGIFGIMLIIEFTEATGKIIGKTTKQSNLTAIKRSISVAINRKVSPRIDGARFRPR